MGVYERLQDAKNPIQCVGCTTYACCKSFDKLRNPVIFNFERGAMSIVKPLGGFTMKNETMGIVLHLMIDVRHGVL